MDNLSHNSGLNVGFDIEKVRADFPILSRLIHGKPLVYLDSGASAQKPQVVIDAISHAYEHEYSNVHRGLHYLSNATTDAYEKSREQVRTFLNAESVDEIIFTKSTTEAINLIAYGYGEPNIAAGDEIVLSIMEHHSNIVPWHFLRERQGAALRWVDINQDGSFDLNRFEQALSKKTKLVAITHMSNVLGTIVPIKEICAIAHKRGIPVLVDGSQAAVHLPVDVRDLDADFYVMTGHKLYGPSGVGVLYGKMELLKSMRPFLGGGEMIVDVMRDNVTYADPPHRFEAGTPPIVQAIGLGVALQYMQDLGRQAILSHENSLRDYARDKLLKINSLRLFGDADNGQGKGAIFSFELEGIHAHDVSMVIDREGVAVRAGTHCAQTLLEYFGVTSTCRASFGLYNTKSDVDTLVASLEKARSFFT
ncbi:MAG: cysteine desulfurase [Hyphomicrobiales bacterium]|nr:cysteine desulfurase [Hyphomicrobiales bacterium]